MSADQKISWSQRFAIAKQVLSVIWRGGSLLRQVGEAAGALPTPKGDEPMSAHSVLSAVISAALRDKTWIQAAAMAARADQFLNSGDVLVRVVRDHGKVAQDDVRLGIEIAALMGSRLAAEATAFLSGPLGVPAVALLQFWLTGLLTGSPVQPKDPAYRLPEGPDGGISTGG